MATLKADGVILTQETKRPKQATPKNFVDHKAKPRAEHNPKKRAATTARNTRILAKSIEGRDVGDIAAEENLSRTTISQIVNHSPEAKKYQAEVAARFEGLMESAMGTIGRVVASIEPSDTPSALKAAIYVIERIVGKIPEKIQIEDEFKNLTRDNLILILKQEMGLIGSDAKQESEEGPIDY